jgi:hypothetical protein
MRKHITWEFLRKGTKMPYVYEPGWAKTWRSLEGVATSGPGAVLKRNSKLAVFVTGTDSKCHYREQIHADEWVGWETIPGDYALASAPAVCLNKGGAMEVFAVGTDQAMYHIWQVAPEAAWMDYWKSLKGGFIGGPTAILQQSGSMAIFGRGTDNHCYHLWQEPNGQWISAWEDLGGDLTSDPDVTMNAAGGLEVFATFPDKAVWHMWQNHPNGQWSQWASLEGESIRGPAAATSSSGGISVFVEGTTQKLYSRGQLGANGNWNDWFEIASLIASSDPDVCVNASRGFTVFVLQNDGKLIYLPQGDHLMWVEPPPPEPPKEMIVVPSVLMLESNLAIAKLEYLKFKVISYNFTGEIFGPFIVSHQDPAASVSAEKGSKVNITLAKENAAKGNKSLSFFNCRASRGGLDIWRLDYNSGVWTLLGTFSSNFGEESCPVPGSAAFVVDLPEKHLYQVVAVDKTLIGCTSSDPSNLSCQAWAADFVGDPTGYDLPPYTIG